MRRFRFVYSLATILLSIGLIIYINIGKIRLGLNFLDIKNNDSKIEETENPSNINPLDRIGVRKTKPKQSKYLKDPGELGIEDIIKNNKQLLAEDIAINLISAQYKERFNNLHARVENEISNLIQAGVTDYNSGKYSLTNIANKYLSEGEKLEQIFDVEFNSLLSQLEKELVENNYDTSVLGDIKEYYMTYKSVKKAEIIAKGMDLGQGR